MRWCCIALCFVSFLTYMDAAKILAIFPLPGKSHFVMFERILKGLAEKGHQVDVYNHFPQKEPIEGYNDISLAGTQQVFVNNASLELFVGMNRFVMLYAMLSTAGHDVCTGTFNSDMGKELLNTTKKYDLMLTELFVTDCMSGYAHHFGLPVVAMSSSVILPWFNDRFGNPDNPSYIPSYEIGYTSKMTLFERVVNTFYVLSAKLFYRIFSLGPANRMGKDFFGKDLPDIEDLVNNISLVLVNSHFSTNQARPTVPNFVEVGGVHLDKPKPLNEHFQELVTTDSKGIIYFSMGSMVLSDTFAVNKLQGIFDAFAKLPYKILWKAKKKNFPKELNIPKNVHFEKWMPQFDLLCHPNVKLFVSHGGLMGNQEAVYCGVPILGIPLFGDQEMNIKQSVNNGVALKVAYDDISEETILEAATKLLNNPKYKENAKELSKKFLDRPMSPLDTAIYWIEYVIRHKGAPHLRSAGADLPWYQYHLLDVIVIFITTALVLGYLAFVIVKFVFILFKKNGKSKKE